MEQKIRLLICSLWGLTGIIVYNALFQKRNNNLDTSELKKEEVIDTVTKSDYIISETKFKKGKKAVYFLDWFWYLSYKRRCVSNVQGEFQK